ncbi:hypothetical protein CHKEEEPN_4880 [Methylorubrum podarium]|jgi:hypothetical protein|nr:hypothetical protein CHKEEEPN_4880 [Methylorubrum podarium]
MRGWLMKPGPDSETDVPRYFFDTHDGAFHRDEDGTECADLDAVRREAMIFLPEIARWEIPKDGNQRAFTVLCPR